MIPLSIDGFARRVSERLTLDVPTERQELFGASVPAATADEPGPPPKPAAVLVPVVAKGEGTILLTQRAGDLPDHSGQIAFPGGKVDPGDASPLETALREAEEEIGLSRVHVRPLGYIPPFLSRTGYLITPVVALVTPPFRLQPNPREVADVFEVPLAFLMDPRNHQMQSRVWQGARRHFYAMPYGERYIWGITASILRNLWERLAADGADRPQVTRLPHDEPVP